MASKRTRPDTLGTIRKLPSGRRHALYRIDGRQFKAPHILDTKTSSVAWLATEQTAPITRTAKG